MTGIQEPRPAQTTRWHVVTGGPSSGKTTTVNLLRGRGYTTTIEHARRDLLGEPDQRPVLRLLDGGLSQSAQVAERTVERRRPSVTSAVCTSNDQDACAFRPCADRSQDT
ncbi:AAA family ATPase [Microbacterium lacticum]|uniref:AAA family ATPase n=1 Tax=Microbacterium lacticum TaxID=33885 RepID=UPI0018B0EB14|nr:AAA family ATPase [Microbacterium lacticum]MBF9334791.1 AAA family ATPase [Microbacterium lacticum]